MRLLDEEDKVEIDSKISDLEANLGGLQFSIVDGILTVSYNDGEEG